VTVIFLPSYVHIYGSTPVTYCLKYNYITVTNCPDKLYTRSDAYSVELVVLNKHQLSGGRAYLDCYLTSL